MELDGWEGGEYLGDGGETYNQNILHEKYFQPKEKKIYKTFSVKGFTKVTFVLVYGYQRNNLWCIV